VKKLPLFTHVEHCSLIDAPSTHKTIYATPGFPGARPYPFLNNPYGYDPTRPRPPSVNKRITPARRPQEIAHPLPRQGVSPSHRPHHYDTQEWPARTRACRHSSTYCAHPTFFSKTPLGFCCKPRPSPCVYKRKGPRALRGGRKKKHKTGFFPTLAINISSNTPPFSSLETWDRFLLSQLVTPTQALQCKEIQNSPPLAGRRAFFARTRINPRVFSLHHHPD
jgi:hypothetical protein